MLNIYTKGAIAMANKINIELILELRSRGFSQNCKASGKHISKCSVSAVLKRASELCQYCS